MHGNARRRRSLCAFAPLRLCVEKGLRSCFAELVGFVGFFPGELGLASAEVAIRRGLFEDRPPQVEVRDDFRRPGP